MIRVINHKNNKSFLIKRRDHNVKSPARGNNWGDITDSFIPKHNDSSRVPICQDRGAIPVLRDLIVEMLNAAQVCPGFNKTDNKGIVRLD